MVKIVSIPIRLIWLILLIIPTAVGIYGKAVKWLAKQYIRAFDTRTHWVAGLANGRLRYPRRVASTVRGLFVADMRGGYLL
jgi:hypothetical protein